MRRGGRALVAIAACMPPSSAGRRRATAGARPTHVRGCSSRIASPASGSIALAGTRATGGRAGGCTIASNNELRVVPAGPGPRARRRPAARRRAAAACRGADGRPYPFRSGMVSTGPAVRLATGAVRVPLRPRRDPRAPAARPRAVAGVLAAARRPRVEAGDRRHGGLRPRARRRCEMHLHYVGDDGEARHVGEHWTRPLGCAAAGIASRSTGGRAGLRWLVDGVERWRVERRRRAARADVPRRSTWPSAATGPGPPDGVDPYARASLEVDWVRVRDERDVASRPPAPAARLAARLRVPLYRNGYALIASSALTSALGLVLLGGRRAAYSPAAVGVERGAHRGDDAARQPRRSSTSRARSTASCPVAGAGAARLVAARLRARARASPARAARSSSPGSGLWSPEPGVPRRPPGARAVVRGRARWRGRSSCCRTACWRASATPAGSRSRTSSSRSLKIALLLACSS